MNQTVVSPERKAYLELLSRQYPTVQSAATEIINLEAINHLPKGTEHFLSDVHGEHEAFLHILKNGSGVIRKKIDETFGFSLTSVEKRRLATLIYYPEESLRLIQGKEINSSDWYHKTLQQLVLVCRSVSSKYTRSKVRKALPQGFEYILEELLHEQEKEENKQAYYDQIINMIIDIGESDPFIVSICHLIQRFSIDHLHIIGDVFDRGDGPHIIMDKLMAYHSLDFQWGNHDIVWMGAYAGSLPCIANVVRVSLRYGHHELLDEAYGINLLPLAKFAMTTYPVVEDVFMPKELKEIDEQDRMMVAQMHKAITIIMLKLEGHFIKRNPNYQMEDRLILEQINYDNRTLNIEGVDHEVLWGNTPTIDPKDPYSLSERERDVLIKLRGSFMTNEKLGAHVDFLMEKGSMYLVYNGNLLYHGCIPTNEDGSFTTVDVGDGEYKGKALLDVFDKQVRRAYKQRLHHPSEKTLDIFYYLWTGSNSSLFGKHVMKTFERYFLEDKATHMEHRNQYYVFNTTEEYCDKVFEEFGLDPETSRIINGHVPVKVGKGESPVKAGGKIIVIDGGLSKAYQSVTDIAGYTLIYNSHGVLLSQHEPFVSAKDAIEKDIDLISEVSIIHHPPNRVLVGDTDIGKKLSRDIRDLKDLLYLYQQDDL